MSELVILLTAVVFFLLGKYSQTHKEAELVQTITKRLKNSPKAGPIDYITPEQEEYLDSEEEKVDKEWKKSMAGVKI